MWHTHTHTHSVRFVSFPQTGRGDAPIKCRLPVCSVKRLTAKAIRFPPGATSNVEKLMHRACLQLNLNKMLSLLSITRQMPAASYPFVLHSLRSSSASFRHLDSCSKLRNWLARGSWVHLIMGYAPECRMSKQRQRITNQMLISLCWRCTTLKAILAPFSIFNFGLKMGI